jgi:hypothetical protein
MPKPADLSVTRLRQRLVLTYACPCQAERAAPPATLAFVQQWSLRSAVVAAGVAAPALATLLDRQVGDDEGGERVEPREAEEGVVEQAEQDGARETRWR